MLEEAIVACILVEENKEEYIDMLEMDDFANHNNQVIIGIMKKLRAENKGIDYVTVASLMPWSEVSIKVLPTYELSYSLSHITDYIKELKKRTAKRKLQQLLSKASTDVVQGTDVEEIVQQIMTKMNEIDLVDKNKLIDVGTIDHKKYSDRIRVKSELSNLDKMIGGFCMGELSVWTGKSGQGKSTLLSQLMLNAVNQGFKVCAYSGELINEQFQHWLLLQACGPEHLTKEMDSNKQHEIYKPADDAVARIKNWLKGKYFLYNNEFTGKDSNIIDVFKVAYKRGCRVFLVDNLMTAKYNYNSKESYYIQQSGFVGELVRFAKTYNVHVHLIAHPKKTAGEISKEDISGSLDITNRADNAFSVNRDEETGQTMVSILKNRSDGIQKKQIALNFDVNCKRFTPYGNDLAQYKKYRWEWEK